MACKICDSANSLVVRFQGWFLRKQLERPLKTRFTLEEIAQRIALKNGLSYEVVIQALRNIMYGSVI